MDEVDYLLAAEMVATVELGWSADRIDDDRERFARDLDAWSPP